MFKYIVLTDKSHVQYLCTKNEMYFLNNFYDRSKQGKVQEKEKKERKGKESNHAARIKP